MTGCDSDDELLRLRRTSPLYVACEAVVKKWSIALDANHVSMVEAADQRLVEWTDAGWILTPAGDDLMRDYEELARRIANAGHDD